MITPSFVMSTCLSRRAPVLVVGTLTAILLHFFGPEGRLRIGHWGGGDGELEDPKLVLKRVSSAGMIADVFKDRTIEELRERGMELDEHATQLINMEKSMKKGTYQEKLAAKLLRKWRKHRPDQPPLEWVLPNMTTPPIHDFTPESLENWAKSVEVDMAIIKMIQRHFQQTGNLPKNITREYAKANINQTGLVPLMEPDIPTDLFQTIHKLNQPDKISELDVFAKEGEIDPSHQQFLHKFKQIQQAKNEEELSFKRQVDTQNDDNHQAYLEEIHDSSNRFKRLRKQAKELANTGAFQLDRTPEDILGLVEREDVESAKNLTHPTNGLDSVVTQTIAGGLPPITEQRFMLGQVDDYNDGIGTHARFWRPYGIVHLPDNSLIVSDNNAHTIRRIKKDGTVETIAGIKGEEGYVDGPASQAKFNCPASMAYCRHSSCILVSEMGNSVIRKISADFQKVSTFFGIPSHHPPEIRNDDQMFTPETFRRRGLGEEYMEDSDIDTEEKLENITSTAMALLAPKPLDMLYGPDGLAFDRSGCLYVSDCLHHRIVKISPDGTKMESVAGAANRCGRIDGTGTNSLFHFPHGLAIGPSENGEEEMAYVADTMNDCIRKINLSSNEVTSVTEPSFMKERPIGEHEADPKLPSGHAYGVCVDRQGLVYFTQAQFTTVSMIHEGKVSTIAGKRYGFACSDGMYPTSRLAGPSGITIGTNGEIYVCDQANRRIRLLSWTKRRDVDLDGLFDDPDDIHPMVERMKQEVLDDRFNGTLDFTRYDEGDISTKQQYQDLDEFEDDDNPDNQPLESSRSLALAGELNAC
ncbi:hypothetical protein AAMO2058_000289700 [Amorphochlora amoebiformis]